MIEEVHDLIVSQLVRDSLLVCSDPRMLGLVDDGLLVGLQHGKHNSFVGCRTERFNEALMAAQVFQIEPYILKQVSFRF